MFPCHLLRLISLPFAVKFASMVGKVRGESAYCVGASSITFRLFGCRHPHADVLVGNQMTDPSKLLCRSPFDINVVVNYDLQARISPLFQYREESLCQSINRLVAQSIAELSLLSFPLSHSLPYMVSLTLFVPLQEVLLDHVFETLGVRGSSVAHPIVMTEPVAVPSASRACTGFNKRTVRLAHLQRF